MIPETSLAELLLEWEERQDAGRPVTPEELCRDCPEMLGELRRRIGLLRAISPLLDLDGPARPAEELPTFPGFETLAELGGGGMGVVYQARDLALDRVVAIKVPRRTVLVDSHARERFEREARVLAQLKHPNIVPIHQAALLQGHPYFVMDYVTGGSLAERRPGFASDPVPMATLLSKVARAIDHAHQNGIVHRDLKPSNILLDDQGEPLVGDFGVAGLRESSEPSTGGRTSGGTPGILETPRDNRLTRTGQAVGTPAYMAPEQFAADREAVDRAADVWALGVILYELLTGQLPFRANDPSELQALIRHVVPPRPRSLNSRLDRRLEVVVLKCLAKAPGERYTTAAALADDLARWRQSARRKRYAKRVAAAVICGAVLTLVGLPWVWPKDAETQHMAKLQQTMQALGQSTPVDLVPDKGLPVSFHVREGASLTHASLSEDGAFTVYAPKLALVELLPDVQVERYRFTAEVRQNSCHGEADVGIYYAHQHLQTPAGMAHVFGKVRFADLGPAARSSKNESGQEGSRVAVRHFYYRGAAQPVGAWNEYSGRSRWYAPGSRDQGAASAWRLLTVEVTPEHVQAQMGELRLDVLPRRAVVAWRSQLPRHLPELSGLSVELTRRGGLGLFVNNCQASFRRCRVEPFQKP